MNRKLNHVSGTIANLKKNNPFQFALRHALQIYKSNLIYTFIPKNACSTMRYSIARANGFINDDKDINWIHENNNTFNPDLNALVTANYTFITLRCPYSRLASAFLDKFVRQTPDAFHFYIATGRAVNPMDLTFRQFVKLISKAPFLRINIHWRPQIDFLIYHKYDDYFSVENFKEQERTLMEKFDFKLIDARHLTNHGIDTLNFIQEDRKNCDLPIIDLINMKRENNIVPPDTLYDEDIYYAVTKLYHQDLELYKRHFGAEKLLKLI